MINLESILKEAHWIGKIAQEEDFAQEFRKYRLLLNKMKRKKSIKKLEVLFDRPRMNKPDIYWAKLVDSTEATGSIDVMDFARNLRLILKRNLPIASFLKKILNYGLSKGHISLNRTLEKGRVRFDVLKQREDPLEKNITVEQTTQEYSEVDKQLKQKIHQHFSDREPTTEELKQLKQKDPVAYKEISKLKREKTNTYKEVKTSIFIEAKSESLDVDEFKIKMKSVNMDPKIDNGFQGRVGVDGSVQTHRGRKFSALLGKDVKMNSQYDEETDNAFYCTSINASGNLVHHYTDDFMLRHKKEKYLKNQKFGAVIEDMRGKVNEDLESPDKAVQTTALMVTLVDQAYFRIGNSGSEKKNVRGLHNLQIKHLKFEEDGKMHFRYVGKDKVHQHKIIADQKIYGMCKELVEGKGPNDYIFSFEAKKGKEKRIKPADVNVYMKKRLESPVTIHKFRTFHSTRMAKEMLEKINIDPKVTMNKIMNVFKSAVNKIAKFMGHSSSNTTVKHYIDSSVLQAFFDRFKIDPPKVIANLIVATLGLTTKFAKNEDYIPVVSDKTITPEEEKFNEWMATLSPKIMERDGITVKGAVDNEEKFFL